MPLRERNALLLAAGYNHSLWVKQVRRSRVAGHRLIGRFSPVLLRLSDTI
jgi:hypothetical protein